MHIYLKNIPDKFHTDPIWNDGALRVLLPNTKKKNKKMSSDMWSVPDQK